MTPDVILCWPNDCDYPLWRQWLAKERQRFAKVIVVFTPGHGASIQEWLIPRLGALGVTWMGVTYTAGDWRNDAVRLALRFSDAEWVWFTEQDFIITDPDRFWAIVQSSESFQGAGFRDTNGRWHPACLFVKRSLIDKTRRYFGPEPVDHFWAFSQELRDIWEINPMIFDHIQGLTEAQHLIASGRPLTFKPDRIHQYLRDCLLAGIGDLDLEPQWRERMEKELRLAV